ncbi:hypothetical protein ACFL7D_09745 [candidate division KSB1 bacterium]
MAKETKRKKRGETTITLMERKIQYTDHTGKKKERTIGLYKDSFQWIIRLLPGRPGCFSDFKYFVKGIINECAKLGINRFDAEQIKEAYDSAMKITENAYGWISEENKRLEKRIADLKYEVEKYKKGKKVLEKRNADLEYKNEKQKEKIKVLEKQVAVSLNLKL